MLTYLSWSKIIIAVLGVGLIFWMEYNDYQSVSAFIIIIAAVLLTPDIGREKTDD